MRTVHTTMRPGEAIEVDDAEYLDLLRQGLLLPDGAGVPVVAQTYMHIDQPPQTPTFGAEDAAELQQDPPTDPASPETTDAPASTPEGG